ncbi:hypothetical protein MUK42_08017, partial [Musa troglodytarum]
IYIYNRGSLPIPDSSPVLTAHHAPPPPPYVYASPPVFAGSFVTRSDGSNSFFPSPIPSSAPPAPCRLPPLRPPPLQPHGAPRGYRGRRRGFRIGIELGVRIRFWRTRCPLDEPRRRRHPKHGRPALRPRLAPLRPRRLLLGPAPESPLPPRGGRHRDRGFRALASALLGLDDVV